MKTTEQSTVMQEKLMRLVEAFCPILYEDDEQFMENMKSHCLAGDDIRRYRHWEWTQGVGLYGLWRLFEKTKEQRYLDILTHFFDEQLAVGFPSLNVNTVTPFLTMACVGEYLHDEKYLAPCRETAAAILANFPRTQYGGFQHLTSDTLNEQELWDDTLFMTVLFLANMGRIEGKQEYIDEAVYQFLLHAQFLADRKTGLWYHGWTFRERNNFAGAFWGRGNSWVTMAIPELLQTVPCSEADRRLLTALYRRQVDALCVLQDDSGMWHTLLDDPTSYLESSATSGFAYGIARGIHTGLLESDKLPTVNAAVDAILEHIGADGVVTQVSYGTPMGRKSKDFYKAIPLQPMPYGQAMAMLLLIEMM